MHKMGKGYSLIEMMLVISLILFVSTLTVVPYFKAQNFDHKMVLNSFLMEMNFARERAMAETKPIFIIPIHQQWERGIQVADADHHIIKTIKFNLTSSDALRCKFFPEEKQPYIEFIPNGSSIQNGHIQLWNHRNLIWTLVINKGGRVKVIRSA